MSFQGLISGSECAVPANPLSQVLKHTEGDRSLQQDRLAGPSSSRLHHLPGSSANAASEHDLAQARQFFEGPARPPQNMHSGPHFAEMRQNGPIPGSDWQQNFSENSPAIQNWASEFNPMTTQSPFQSHTAEQADVQLRGQYMPPMGYTSSRPLMGGMNHSYAPGPSIHQQDYSSKGKGKGMDFDAAFAQFSEEPQSSSRIEEVTDSTAAMAEIAEKLGESSMNDPEFRQVWDQLQNSDLPPAKEEMAKWEAEFNQLMSGQREDPDADYGAAMQSAWETGLGDYNNTTGGPETRQFDAGGTPLLGDYAFEPNNKFMDPSGSAQKGSLAAAKALLESNGSLSEAALMIEAAIQDNDLGEGGYEAWILLGEVRNMDEREEAGLKALIEGVKRAEAAGAAGEGMLSLAISYTNENYDRASHATLVQWLRAKFPDYPVPEETISALKTHSTWDTHARITDLFIGLAQSQNNQGLLDPDVQTGLGVLFYTNNEYDKAKDCFAAALSMKPKDYLLWNRLGSSLSNGNGAEEALGAYREALQLRPTYTRAIYNVGVACLNIGAYREAAEHLLSALRMQEKGKDTSEQLWFTLRRAFIHMDRPDLAELTKPEGRTLEHFKKEGFDF